jgi:hypothetical protein
MKIEESYVSLGIKINLKIINFLTILLMKKRGISKKVKPIDFMGIQQFPLNVFFSSFNF